MRRLAATMQTDARLQARNGFYLATAVVMVSSIVLLRWLPANAAMLFFPAVILGNVLVNTFYFASGMLLLERIEGTFMAQSVTPLRLGEYLASKVGTLTALSLAESSIIAVASFGVGAWLATVAAGVGLAAVLLCLAGIALVLRYESINEFLLPSVLYSFLLSVPVLSVFGLGDAALYWPHPIQGTLALMRIDATWTPRGLVYAISWPLLWTIPGYLWSRRALARSRMA
jgi:fluoroquinolone transport system permease protein